ncbi:hypothetical protein CBM2617_U10001 [Cupriavidus taiwanensis]|nr:hypothetical protein CBM2617_U10001 [Cupriavidus taiwanensis]
MSAEIWLDCYPSGLSLEYAALFLPRSMCGNMTWKSKSNVKLEAKVGRRIRYKCSGNINP